MKNHTDLINYLINLRDLKSYLEIGVCRRDHNFNHIVCDFKICVDPDAKADADYQCTSDWFFENIMDSEENGPECGKFGLIFIDGLHHADQVEKDFENALVYLTDNGFIVMHDTNPHSERITHVPRDNGEWTGDVYRFACTLSRYSGVQFLTVDFDYGVTVVWKTSNVCVRNILPKITDFTWSRFAKEKQELLRLIPVSEINKIPA